MMHDQPNNPEYCQGIYEAAKQLVDYCDNAKPGHGNFFLSDLGRMVANLKRALEGKP